MSSTKENLPSWLTEVKLMLTLATTTAIVNLTTSAPNAMSASFVGRLLGVIALDGLSLACIAVNWTCMSFIQGIMWASDTLAPQALGTGNLGEVGVVVFRAFVVAMTVVVPLNVLASFVLEPVLIASGEDPEASHLAPEWYRIYLVSIPFAALFSSVWRFLSAQEKMFPVVAASLFGMLIVLPASLQFLIKGFGFKGSAWAVVIFQATAAMSLLLGVVVFRPHSAPTWPGFHAVFAEWYDFEKLALFLKLAGGGVLAMSEWWLWELIFAIVGTFGFEVLSAHSIAVNVTMTFQMIPFALGSAMTVRVGSTLPKSVPRSKSIAAWTLFGGTMFLLLCSCGLYAFRKQIYALFTTNEAVIEMCEKIWILVSIYNVLTGFYGIVIGVLFGLGKQTVVGVSVMLSLWAFGLPLFYFFSVVIYDRDLVVGWMAMAPPYLIVNVYFCWVFLREDWDKISMEVRKRNEREHSQEDESVALLPTTESTPLKSGSKGM